MLLSDRDLRAALTSGRMGLSPFDEAMIQPSSIDVRLEQLGEVVLRDRRVDVGVAVVGEDPEVAVQAYVDAARLDHRLVVRREAHPAGGEGGAEVTIRKQHGRSLVGRRRAVLVRAGGPGPAPVSAGGLSPAV